MWRHPVKSVQGERVESATFQTSGMAGDREWGIRDEPTGKILTARRRPELLAAAATYDEDVPVITLSDGRRAVGPGAATDRLLSEWLASPVSLVPAAGRESGTAEYFADATDDNSEAIEWTMPIGRFVDSSPVLVLTTASLRTAARLCPHGDWDPRRFRPNDLITSQLGAVALIPIQPYQVHVGDPCPTWSRRRRRGLSHPGPTSPGPLGVWSDVLEGGRLSLGDRAVVIGPARHPAHPRKHRRRLVRRTQAANTGPRRVGR